MPRKVKTYHHITSKVCSRCSTEKPIAEFHFRRKDTGLRNAFCIACQKVIKHDHYVDNKDRYLAMYRARDLSIKTEINTLKSDLKCSTCGEGHIATLQFHHIDPESKEIGIASAICKGWSLERIKKEIEKCIVLCANCHFKLHYVENNIP